MKVKLIKNWGGHEAGTVLEVDEAKGNSLVLTEMAKAYSEADEAATKAADAAKVKQNADTKAIVKDALTQALADMPQQDGIKLHIEMDKKSEKPFASMADQLQAVKAYGSGNATEEIHNRLKAASGSNELVDSEGGFLVQQDFQPELQHNVELNSTLFGAVSKINVMGNGLKWNEVDDYSKVAGAHPTTVYWVEEAGTLTSSKPAFINRNMSVKKVAGLYYATEELLEDRAALAGEVTDWFGSEMPWEMDRVIFEGNGAGQPSGFMNSDALVSQAKETSQTAVTINAANVSKMYSRMPARYIGGAVWLINPDAFPQLPQMTIGDQPIFQPPSGFAAAPLGTLLGRPIVFCDHCATLGSEGDIVFANLSQYKMIQKGGIKSSNSIHVRFINDEIAFKFTMRVDGATKQSKVITPTKGSNTLSPFVALAVRA